MTARPLRAAAFAAFAAAACSATAAAEVVDIDWGAQGRFERSVTVAAGKFVEVCGKLAKDARIRWSFAADRPLDFNVHYHAGKDVVYPAKQDAVARASGELVVPVDQDYCWMWSAPASSAARIAVTLTR